MYFLSLFYLFLPAFCANTAPLLIRRVPGFRHWTTPVNERHLGSHKTWRGLVCGIAVAIIVSLLQYRLQSLEIFRSISLLDTSAPESLQIGMLLGSGALIGDMVKSLIKRGLGIAPGQPFFFWDGVDYIIGAMVFLSPLYVPSVPGIIFLIFLAPVLSLLSNIFAYLVGWKNVWH